MVRSGMGRARPDPAVEPRRRWRRRLYDASTSGLVPGDFVFLEFGLAGEVHVNVISVDR